jgi:hypothetical protein
MGMNESPIAQIYRCSTSPKEYSKGYRILGAEGELYERLYKDTGSLLRWIER